MLVRVTRPWVFRGLRYGVQEGYRGTGGLLGADLATILYSETRSEDDSQSDIG